ncbi:MAG: rRNA maturation RNase YbeY [Proteobacteria bacterium]|nr:rRNA maturation RNase YbeY [Pseudomonadota bacterium]
MTQIEIVTEAEGWERIADCEAIIRRAVAAALEAGGARAGEITLLLADDARVHALNRDYRGFDKPTNVLSFPAATMPGDEAPALGDIALAFETCAREAREEGKELPDHLTHLVVHGVLHLLGHDHETDDEAEAMEALEVRVLAGLGINDPYRVEEKDPAR